MKYTTVIFDLDGTLLNTIEDIADSINCALEKNGFSTHSVAQYKLFIGEGIETLVRKATGLLSGSDEIVGKCLADAKEEYHRRWNNKSHIYDGVANMLDELDRLGVMVCVLSNKPHDFTVLAQKEYFSKWNFGYFNGARDEVPHKPDSAGALEIADLIGVSADECVFVGDSAIDINTAINAGMLPVGVSWGFSRVESIIEAGAKKVLNEPSDLLELFSPS